MVDYDNTSYVSFLDYARLFISACYLALALYAISELTRGVHNIPASRKAVLVYIALVAPIMSALHCDSIYIWIEYETRVTLWLFVNLCHAMFYLRVLQFIQSNRRQGKYG